MRNFVFFLPPRLPTDSTANILLHLVTFRIFLQIPSAPLYKSHPVTAVHGRHTRLATVFLLLGTGHARHPRQPLGAALTAAVALEEDARRVYQHKKNKKQKLLADSKEHH